MLKTIATQAIHQHATRMLWLSLLALSPLSQTYAAPKSDLWSYWNHSQDTNTQQISHQAWQGLLTKYVSKRDQHHVFDYANVTTKDKAILNQYISQLTRLDPRTFNKNQQFAYWVNLYNVLTVKLILDNYPVSSITKLGGFFDFGPWDLKITRVAGQELSLNDIEHRILRPIWQDPRIHYVVNCASLGCPNLPIRPINAKQYETQLEQAARDFINSDKGAQIDNNTLILSSIYDWYAEDFGNNRTDILRHINSYRSGKPLAQWQNDVTYEYDWSLNKK